jgi:hypothetical protein
VCKKVQNKIYAWNIIVMHTFMSGIYQFSMLSLNRDSDVCSCILAGFCRAHHPDRPVNSMKLPHDSAAAQFYETDIGLLDGKVMMEQFMLSVASSWPKKLSLSIRVCRSCL